MMVAMTTILSSPASDWLDILSRLPADLDLDVLARETKAIQRARGVADASDLSRPGRRGRLGPVAPGPHAWPPR